MRIAAFALFLSLSLLSSITRAEPYFAVREGLKCVSCHVSPTGGGMRTTFGTQWAQTALPARRIELPNDLTWTGNVNRFIGVGADLRAGATHTDVPDEDSQSEFELEEARAYAHIGVIPERLSLYVDQRIAPGGSSTMEAYARYMTSDQRWYARVGQFYLPFGWRIEDDTAFIREVPAINMNTPDQGIEVGFEGGPWSVQLAGTNGTGGGTEEDEGKQGSLRAEYVLRRWRLGASYNLNHTDAGDRQMAGLFAGVRTGPIVWLAEADYIEDETLGALQRNQWVGLAEANWWIVQGHNLKLTAEMFEPDDDVDEDEQARYSAVYEWNPIQFLQLRAGARVYDGIPQNNLQNRRVYFVSVHGFF